MTVPSIRALAAALGMSHTILNRYLKEGRFQEEPGGGFDVDRVRATLRPAADPSGMLIEGEVLKTDGGCSLVVENWPISRPRPYEKNARKWSGMAVDKLCASIKEFGFVQPIVVDESDVIIIGHLRLAAARELGLREVPVHVARGLNPEQVKALRIADNRTHEEAEWDLNFLGQELVELRLDNFDMSLTAFDGDEIVEKVFGKKKRSRKNGGASAADGVVFAVMVECEGEQQQAELIERFRLEGLKCKAVTE